MEEEEIKFRKGRNSFPTTWLTQYPDFAMYVLAYRRGLANPNWMNAKMLGETEYNIKKFIKDKRKEEHTHQAAQQAYAAQQAAQQAYAAQHAAQQAQPLLPRKSFCRVLSNGVKRCFGYPTNNHIDRARTRKARTQRKRTRRVR